MAMPLPRKALRSRGDMVSRFWPSNRISPVMRALGSSRPIMASEVMDLPHPDSPTSATVSPGRTVKETLSTTLTLPWRGKPMLRLRTSSNGGRLVSATRRSVRASSTARSAARRSSSDTTGSAEAASDASASLGCSSWSMAAATAVASTWALARGAAMASVMPSASTLSASTVMVISAPANRVGHQAPDITSWRPAAMTLPQDGSGSGTPA